MRNSGKSDQRGFVYVAILILTCTLCLIAVTFLTRIGHGTGTVMARSNAIQAKYLAESAVNHAIWRLMNEKDFPADPNQYYMHNLGRGRYGYMVRRPVDVRPGSIAAIGAIAGSVVMESYVIALPLPPTQMVTGSFTGNGAASRAITGVGFRPDLVIVKSEANRIGVVRSSTMSGDLSKPMTGTTVLTAGLVRSLDNDGFTVGSNNSVNESGQTIHWAAFRAPAGQMAVGTYVGDGSNNRTISGFGFTPSLVIILPAAARDPVFALDGSTQSFDFDNSNGLSNCVTTPFLPGGFRIGNDNQVNRSGETFHYACWTEIAGQQETSTYTGSGVDNRDIPDVGFQPEYLLVRCTDHGRSTVHKTLSTGRASDKTLFFAGTAAATNRVQRFNTNGFQVGSDQACDQNGWTYAWFAWIRK